MKYENVKPMEEFGFWVTENNVELVVKDLAKKGIVIDTESIESATCGYDLQLLLDETEFAARFIDEVSSMVVFEKLPNEQHDSLFIFATFGIGKSVDTMRADLNRIFPSIPNNEIGWHEMYDYEDEYRERDDED